MQMTPATPETVAAFWASYVAATGVRGEPLEAFAFGDSAEMADELADLVLAGTKRATAGTVAECAANAAAGGAQPKVGDYSVLLRGDGTPVAVICTTHTRVGTLSSVDEQFAWDEGEGERTREWWLAAHRRYFRRTFAAHGWKYDKDLEVVSSWCGQRSGRTVLICPRRKPLASLSRAAGRSLEPGWSMAANCSPPVASRVGSSMRGDGSRPAAARSRGFGPGEPEGPEQGRVA